MITALILGMFVVGVFSALSWSRLFAIAATLLGFMWLNACAPLDTKASCGDFTYPGEDHVSEKCFDTMEQCSTAEGVTNCQEYDNLCAEEGRSRICFAGRDALQDCNQWRTTLFANPSECVKEGQ